MLLSNHRKTSVFFLVIYLSIALDSLLKFNFGGFRIHLGIFIIILSLPFLFWRSSFCIPKAFVKGLYLHIFFFYCVISLLIFNSDNIKMLMYIFMIYMVFIYVHMSAKYWTNSFFYYFQLILLITGFIQFFSYLFFGIQISFIDLAHYEKGFSVSYRLRGFFIEPNWYAIALGFNTILLFKNNVGDIFKHNFTIIMLTIFASILNGSIAIFATIIFLYLWFLGKKKLLVTLFSIPFVLLFVYGFVMFRSSVSADDTLFEILNHYSRLEPLLRVFDYQMSQGLFSIIFGNGFGTWGTIAIENRLSVLVYEVNPLTRDASELPVFIFELGVLGLSFIILDIIRTYLAVNNTDYYLKISIILFLVCIIFYPILKFWMYMPYYFYIRYLIYAR